MPYPTITEYEIVFSGKEKYYTNGDHQKEFIPYTTVFIVYLISLSIESGSSIPDIGKSIIGVRM